MNRLPRVTLRKVKLIKEAGFECEEADGLYNYASKGIPIVVPGYRSTDFKCRKQLFERDGIIYKFWWPGYFLQENLIWAIQTGFFTKEFCPALIGVILHATGMCGGYWMYRFKISLNPNALNSYRQELIDRSKATGCRYADYHNKNVGTYNGKHCLIDLESVTDL